MNGPMHAADWCPRAADWDHGAVVGPMHAADWCPRAADWDHGAVVVSTIDEVWEDHTLDYVVYPKTAGELERKRRLVQSSENAPDITFVLLKGDGALEAGSQEFAEVEWTEARVPGTWRNNLRVASVWMAQCSPETPSLSSTVIKPKAPVVQSTSVLRVHSDWVCCEKGEKAWAEITKKLGAHFRAWTWAAHSLGSIKDTWQWQLTRGPGGAEATVEGLIRMLGVRRVASEAELAKPRTLRRLWRACAVPRSWCVEEVAEFLAECRFEEPCVALERGHGMDFPCYHAC